MINRGDKINDRYQIVKTIGEGGMANVYLANDVILDRQVAVKVLRGDLADDDKFVRRFQREALSASKLTHPNIVEMYDVGQDKDKYYIVMEYVNGKTLKNWIKKRGTLTLPEIVDIMNQLLSAVICAHDSYIIHRDIKPQNILMLDDGRVKITDFGIAMALNSNELTQTNSVMGSVHYLPPEQANGGASTIKCDIYSLGILMYELLTGKVPFKGDNAVEIAIKQMKEPIPSVCKLMPDIPQAVENIILRACAKNPKNRYESVREMQDDIKGALTEDAVIEKRISYKYPEQELEETKVMPNLSRLSKSDKESDDVSKPKKSKKSKALWITGGICASLLVMICLFIIIYPKITETKDIQIPSISDMNVADAEKLLREKGFKVSSDVLEKENDEVKPGIVTGTNPQAGRTVKEGTEITIIIAKESGKITVDDYKGQNYKTVEANLKNAGINVLVETESIKKEDQSKYKENTVVNQSVKKDTKLDKGDTIVIYYAVYSVEYPDFTKENWDVHSIQAFCDKNSVTLKIEPVTKDEYEEGTVIKQSRTGEVIGGSVLTITVTTKSVQSESDETGQGY